MNKFIKENIVLIIGISLPILMVIIFGLATILPGYFVPPPKFDLLYYTGGDIYNNKGLKAVTNHGKVSVYAYCTQFCEAKYLGNFQPIRFYIFNTVTKQTKEIKVDAGILPNVEIPFEKEISVPEINALTINPDIQAPDGYAFSNGNYRNGGIFTEIFYGSHYTQPSINKSGAHIALTHNIPRYSWSDIKFVGWIMPGRDK